MKSLRTLGWFKKNYAPDARSERGARKLVTDGLVPHVRIGEEMLFDVDAALDQSDKNPVYKVQYAHARMCSIFATAGIRPESIEAGRTGSRKFYGAWLSLHHSQSIQCSRGAAGILYAI